MSGVTTQNLSGREIPKRLPIGSKKPISHLNNDKMVKMALMQFEKDKQENGYAKYKDVLDKIKAKYSK